MKSFLIFYSHQYIYVNSNTIINSAGILLLSLSPRPTRYRSFVHHLVEVAANKKLSIVASDAIDYEQFHNSKDLTLAISMEVGALLELFLWKEASVDNPEKIKILAISLSLAFPLAEKRGLDAKQMMLDRWNPVATNIRWRNRGAMPKSAMISDLRYTSI